MTKNCNTIFSKIKMVDPPKGFHQGIMRAINKERKRMKKEEERRGGYAFRLPIYGMANAGSPDIVADQQVSGYLNVSCPSIKKRKNVFAVKVSGTSMDRCSVNGKYLKNGDYAIVDPGCRDFRDDNVMLVIVNGSATIKKIKKVSDDEIELSPKSSKKIHLPWTVGRHENVAINGEVIDVFPNSDRLVDQKGELVYEKV